ncbi:MAG TPA: transglutaminase domain-containing protein [Pirellulales bacterium]|nr:transglutaminase domain-containing protein [Pirellulales bacterium]
MQRRNFLKLVAGGGTIGGAASSFGRTSLRDFALHDSALRRDAGPAPPAFSVIPVVGDGHWIWNEPPADETGYLEPRSYSLDIGIELEGLGEADSLLATTPVPVEHPEQKIEEFHVETEGCEATVRELAAGMGQLLLSADSLAQGAVARAIVHYKLTLFKQSFNYERDQFPAQQKPAAELRKAYLQDSPGIQTGSKQVRTLAAELCEGLTHPWDKARRFAEWIPKNIRPQIGSYTSVTAALDRRLGDCEEMSAVFVALCRSIGMPARLVWVPNHNWAEFYLVDSAGAGHWIPAHTACYAWFGWTGAHELVLQKGDRVLCPEQHKRVRLLEDWMQYGGRKPRAMYVAELTPQPPADGGDAGPGHRIKDAKGEWALVGDHELDRYLRR